MLLACDANKCWLNVQTIDDEPGLGQTPSVFTCSTGYIQYAHATRIGFAQKPRDGRTFCSVVFECPVDSIVKICGSSKHRGNAWLPPNAPVQRWRHDLRDCALYPSPSARKRSAICASVSNADDPTCSTIQPRLLIGFQGRTCRRETRRSSAAAIRCVPSAAHGWCRGARRAVRAEGAGTSPRHVRGG